MNTFTISCIPYYDRYNKCYMSALSVNEIPQGPLSKLIQRVQYPKLSVFHQPNNCHLLNKCKYLISTGEYCKKINCCNFMSVEHISYLTSFLLSNGYQIESQLTNVMNNSEIRMPQNKILYVVTYYGNNSPQIVYMR
jgi:hypothetical protein